jgi:hypothetical protein
MIARNSSFQFCNPTVHFADVRRRLDVVLITAQLIDMRSA